MITRFKAYFGAEIEVPGTDKTGRRWTTDDIEAVFTLENHAECTSTGGIVDNREHPALIRKEDGNLYANPECPHFAVDAQGTTTLKDREKVERWLNRMLQHVNNQFEYDVTHQCPRVDYWIWANNEIYVWNEEDGLWHNDSDIDPSMPETLRFDQFQF